MLVSLFEHVPPSSNFSFKMPSAICHKCGKKNGILHMCPGRGANPTASASPTSSWNLLQRTAALRAQIKVEPEDIPVPGSSQDQLAAAVQKLTVKSDPNDDVELPEPPSLYPWTSLNTIPQLAGYARPVHRPRISDAFVLPKDYHEQVGIPQIDGNRKSSESDVERDSVPLLNASISNSSASTPDGTPIAQLDGGRKSSESETEKLDAGAGEKETEQEKSRQVQTRCNGCSATSNNVLLPSLSLATSTAHCFEIASGGNDFLRGSERRGTSGRGSRLLGQHPGNILV